MRKRDERIARSPGAASDSPDRAPNPEQPREDPTFARVPEALLRGDEFQETRHRAAADTGSHRLVKEDYAGEDILTDIESCWQLPIYRSTANRH